MTGLDIPVRPFAATGWPRRTAQELLHWLDHEAEQLAQCNSGRQELWTSLSGEVLRQRRITRLIEVESLTHHAHITAAGDKFIVAYAKQVPIQRIRFSVAHEIGHTYFVQYSSRAASATELISQPAIEPLCDYFARALLLPRAKFSARVEQLAPNWRQELPLHIVGELASDFRVAEQAVARRLVYDLLASELSLLCLSPRQESEWRVSWFATTAARTEHVKTTGSKIPLATRGRKIPAAIIPSPSLGATERVACNGAWTRLFEATSPKLARRPAKRSIWERDVDLLVAHIETSPDLYRSPQPRLLLAKQGTDQLTRKQWEPHSG